MLQKQQAGVVIPLQAVTTKQDQNLTQASPKTWLRGCLILFCVLRVEHFDIMLLKQLHPCAAGMDIGYDRVDL